jgi:hypothetical protein
LPFVAYPLIRVVTHRDRKPHPSAFRRISDCANMEPLQLAVFPNSQRSSS